MTNQHWHQKPSMLASLLYVPEMKRGKNREKKHYFLSIQCWVPSHITIQRVCMIKNGAQCWVCMTNTDTKILEFRLQCSTYKNKQITYRNAYSFITYHVMHICLVMLILNLLANFYTAALKTCFSWIQGKSDQEATERVCTVSVVWLTTVHHIFHISLSLLIMMPVQLTAGGTI